MIRLSACAALLAFLSACGVGEAAMDRDVAGQFIVIDHSAYPYGSVYWE